MSWADNLLPASFRGVAFDVLAEQLQGRRALVQHGLPYQDGEPCEYLGRDARHFNFRAVLFGANYDSALKALLSAIEQPDAAELVHPIYGSVQVEVETYTVEHAAERPDYAEIALVFVEATTAPAFFTRNLVQTDSDTVLVSDNGPGWQRGVWDLLARADSLVATVQQYLGVSWSGLVGQLLGLPGIALRLGQLRSQALGIVSGTAELAGHPGAVFDPLVDVARVPIEIRSAIAGVDRSDSARLVSGDTIPATVPGGASLPDAVSAPGGAMLTAARSGSTASPTWPVGMPTDPVQAEAWALLVLVLTELALAVADATAAALTAEIDTPTLTPDEIEAMLLRARALLEGAVSLHRALYPVEPALQVIEPLRNLASLLAGAARRVILAKPPLVERTVAVDTSLRLLAFRWYGDHTRATELLRLNPQLRTPYLIPAGEVLRGYAA